MKSIKILLAFCLLLLAFSLSAQQKVPYEQTHTNQVLSNWQTWSKYFIGIPYGATPSFPADVPDSAKCGALYSRTGSTAPGLYRYNCTTLAWELVATSASLTHYADSIAALRVRYTDTPAMLKKVMHLAGRDTATGPKTFLNGITANAYYFTTLSNAPTATGYLTNDGPQVKYRTNAQVLADIAAAPAFTVATISAMQAYTGAATTIAVADDLRGGIFYLVTTPSTPDGGTIFAATGLGAGKYWKRRYDPSLGVSVLWFGAVPGGVVNSNGAIQAAINVAAASDTTARGIVNFPTGIFLISGLTINSGIKFEGGSNGTNLRMKDTANVAIKIGTTIGFSYLTIENININGSPHALGGILVGSTSFLINFLRMNNVQVSGFNGTGAYGLSLVYSVGNNFNNCMFMQNNINVLIPSSATCTTTSFTGSAGFIGQSGAASVKVIGNTTNLTFRDQVFESDSTQVLHSSGNIASFIFENCWIENANLKGTATSLIELDGETGTYNESTLVMNHNIFVVPANPCHMVAL